jgi:uncharacterized RDD family membrane protein YckC
MMTDKIYAGFWIRGFAGLLDLIFLSPIILVIIYFSGTSSYEFFNFSDARQSLSQVSASTTNNFADLIHYFIGIAYSAYFLSSKRQATIGKILLGIYVVKSDGSKLTLSRSIARAGATLLTSATLGLGFIIVIFTKEKIALHDFICDTRVLYRRKNVE